MSIGLRVTFGALARGAQTGMAGALTRTYNAQQALTSGKRINRASDDPGGAAQVIKLNDALGDVAQYLRNGEEARSFLSLTDSALDGLGSIVRQARDLTLQAANATNSTPEARAALAGQIGRIKEQAVGIAGTNIRGRYLFAGQKTETRPFDPADATNAYQGDAGSLRVEINRGEYVAMNVPGAEVFSTLLGDLDAVRSDILAGDLQNLSAQGVAKMTDGLDRILGARGKTGAVMNQIENTRVRLDTAQQEFTALSSEIGEIDIAQAIVELQAAQNAYQASLASTARTFQQSLMDYLR